MSWNRYRERLRAGWQASFFRHRQGFPLYSTASRPALGPNQPPIRWALGALSPEVYLQEREADYLLPCSADVKVETILSHRLPPSWRFAN
jgi:hypothetical protein